MRTERIMGLLRLPSSNHWHLEKLPHNSLASLLMTLQRYKEIDTGAARNRKSYQQRKMIFQRGEPPQEQTFTHKVINNLRHIKKVDADLHRLFFA